MGGVVTRHYVLIEQIRVWQAMKAGTSVKLYIYWSIFDNFEWIEGYDLDLVLLGLIMNIISNDY